jgi:hypothetical protein
METGRKRTRACVCCHERQLLWSIDASKHPNLQAALDAVPESGGLVTIPPGNYEITEPLRVKTAETRIVGGGAATHIINKSETGSARLHPAPCESRRGQESPAVARADGGPAHQRQ